MATETTAVEHATPLGLEEAGTCVDAHGGAIGMPQLCGEWFPNQIFWLVLSLIVVYFIVSKVILPRIGGVLEERHSVISDYISQAADFKKQAEEAEADYETALTQARAEAQAIGLETKASIQKELDKAVAKADAEIAAKTAESEKAIAVVRESAVENAGMELRKSGNNLQDRISAMEKTHSAGKTSLEDQLAQTQRDLERSLSELKSELQSKLDGARNTLDDNKVDRAALSELLGGIAQQISSIDKIPTVTQRSEAANAPAGPANTRSA